MTTPHNGLDPDITPDPVEEVWLDDADWRARFGVTRSIEEAVEHLVDHAIASLVSPRPTLV